MPANAPARLTPPSSRCCSAHKCGACFVQAETRLGRTFPRPQVHCNMRGRGRRVSAAANLRALQPGSIRPNHRRFSGEVVREVARLLVYALLGERGAARAGYCRGRQVAVGDAGAVRSRTRRHPQLQSGGARPAPPSCMPAPAGRIPSRCAASNKVMRGGPLPLCHYHRCAGPWCGSATRRRIAGRPVSRSL